MTAISKGSDTGPSNPFQALWDLGYTRLVPVIPPNAPISDKSQLAARLRAGEDARGKAPGVRRQDGTWSGMDFVGMEAREPDLAVWARMGASVGIKTGNGIFAVDIDTRDKAAARKLFEIAAATLGPAHVRFGQHPKCLLVYATPDDIPYGKVSFSTETEDLAAVEVLTEGRQFVAHGVHPKTGKLYVWPEGVPKRQALTEVTKDKLDAFLTHAAQVMPKARREHSAANREAPDQEALQAPDWETLKRYVEAVPNTSALFPTRNSYVQMAYAIKGAAPDGHEHAALDLYLDWCERWDGGENGEQNDPDVALADWNRAKPPFRTGFSFIRQHATALWFTPVEATVADDMFAAVEPEKPVAAPLRAGEITLDDLALLPPREWLYGYKVSRKYVTFIASPGGVGKTAYVLAMALSAASGSALLHDSPVRPLRVWVMNLEDDIIEMKRRLKAAFMRYDLDPAVLGNLRVNSGRDRQFTIVRRGRDENFIVLPDYQAVIDEMKRCQIDLLIVDPFLRSHKVPENDNEAQDEVMRLYAQIAQETDAGVVLVHHVKKGAIAGDMDGLRGGSTQGGGARSVLTLAPMSPEEAKAAGVDEKVRRLHVRVDDAKNNMAPPLARAEWLKLESVALNNGTPLYPEGDNVQVATKYVLPGAWEGADLSMEAEALSLIAAGMADGERYSDRSQDGERWAGAVLMSRFGRSKAQASEVLAGWRKAGRFVVEDYMSAKQRKMRKGIVVPGGFFAPETSVFE